MAKVTVGPDGKIRLKKPAPFKGGKRVAGPNPPANAAQATLDQGYEDAVTGKSTGDAAKAAAAKLMAGLKNVRAMGHAADVKGVGAGVTGSPVKTTSTKTTSTTRSTSSGASAGSPSSGGGAPPVSGGTGGAPATTGTGTAAQAVAAAKDPMASLSGGVSPLYRGAYNEIERQRQMADARRLQEAADIDAFKQWRQTGLTKAQADMAASQKTAADQAQAARTDAITRANQATQNALAAIGGISSDAAQRAGLTSAQTANTQQQLGVDSAASQAAYDAAAQRDFLGATADSDAARAANMMREADQRKAQTISDLDAKQADITTQKAAALLDQRNKDRQYGLDKSSLDWARQYQGGQLQVAAGQLQVAQNRAQAQALHNQVMEKLKAGEIDVKQARLLLDQNTQDWKAKDKNADRQLKVWQAQLAQAGKNEARSKNATTFAITLPDKLTGNIANGRKWADLTDSADDRAIVRQVVRNSIQSLKSAYPNLSQVEATRALAQSLGGNRLQDFKGEIARAWRK